MSFRPSVKLVCESGVCESFLRQTGRTVIVHAVAIVAICSSAVGLTATTTTLSVTSNASPVTSVSAGALVTLTASVVSGSTPVSQGMVNFCDATQTYCSDIHKLGSAQLNSSGQAQVHLRPGAGNYSYRAVFLGTPKTAVPYTGSASSASTLIVTGLISTASTIAQSGSSGDYTVTATVFGFTRSQTPPAATGIISFVDSTTGNSVLGTANLSAISGPSWLNVSNPTVGSLPSSIVSGDFNGDGKLDLATGINSVAGGALPSVSILLGDGQGNFAPVGGTLPTAGGMPLVVADFNQDGFPDLVLSNTLNGSLTVLLGNGDGTFAVGPGSPLIGNYGVAPIAVADFNGDGIPDIAAAGGYYLIMWLGNGDGSFTALPTSSSYSPADSFGSMVVGDFNGDGRADIVTPFLILLGKGDGTFTKGSQSLASQGGNLAVGDFDGDGKLDIATTATSNGVAIFLGQGDGTFVAANGSPITGLTSAQGVAVADFNGDGIPDLIIDAATNMTDIYVFLGNGDGTFAEASTGSLSLPCCFNTVVGDFNGDGVSDFASSDFYNGTADIYLTGAKQSVASITGVSISGPTPQNVVAKYPGDGNYSASQSGSIQLLVQAAAPVFSPASGGVIAINQSITLTSPTSGVGIYYQASGALSTNGSYIQYLSPIQVFLPGTVTIQAYASSLTYGQSAPSTATYTVIGSDPVPAMTSFSPAFAAAGGQGVTITIDGSGFTSMSTAYFGTSAMVTQFVSTSEITAQITSAMLATGGVKSVTVQNPTPGGGTSNTLQFEIDAGGSTPPSFTTASATVSAGTAATYPVTLAASATNVSVSCLNLPSGANCSYSAGTLTISTSNSTPSGTYQITVVFTETLPGAAALALAGFLFVPFGSAGRRKRCQLAWMWPAMLGLCVLLVSSCGGGGGSTQPRSHQATTSGVVTLTVQ